jgi:tRNA threonylcarbamoyl adenosine modification protein YeaZ
MNLLCIDTTGRSLVLALVLPGRPLLGHVVDTAGKHAEVLLPEIGTLLQRAELEPAAVDAIGVTLGPGGFTSVRVGLATAKGLCVARPRVLYATSSLRALAFGAQPGEPAGDGATPWTTGVAVVTRAYRGEVYAAMYRAHGVGGEVTAVDELLPPLHATPEAARASLESAASSAGVSAVQLMGDGAESVVQAGASGAPWVHAGASEPLTPRALAAAMLAEVQAGQTRDVAALAPEYLRAPDAALPKAR